MQASEKRRALDESMGIDDDDEDTQANKYLCFRIGKESYGIGIKHLIEIPDSQVSPAPKFKGQGDHDQ